MDLHLLATKVVRRVGEIGVIASLQEAMTYLRSPSAVDEFDSKNGTDTGNARPLWSLKIASTNARFGRKYQATGEAELLEALDFLGIEPSSFTFVDLGCGKGRTLLVASRLGFKRVIGVEFANELVLVARENIRKQGINVATVVEGDAADFSFPDGNLVLYLYNPFSQEVMRKVVSNLKDRHSGQLFVIYKVPLCAELFDSCSFLSPVEFHSSRSSIRIWQFC
jgi:SAM-dependent methyltransferase